MEQEVPYPEKILMWILAHRSYYNHMFLETFYIFLENYITDEIQNLAWEVCA